MIPQILEFVRRHTLILKSFGDVLEVGSYNVNGTVRDVIEAKSTSYIGVDIESGPGVDLVVSDVAELLENGNVYDSIVCCETLEHVLDPLHVVEVLRKLLSPGGLLIITTPTFGFPLHRYPIDCYRFGEDVYRLKFFDGFEIIALEEVRDDFGHPVICCIGRSPL